MVTNHSACGATRPVGQGSAWTPSHTHELIRLRFSTEIILPKNLATTDRKSRANRNLLRLSQVAQPGVWLKH